MQRLPGLMCGDPVYWVESVETLRSGAMETQLGFSDVAAHPYEALVHATVAVLAEVPGVEEVAHVDREVILVRSRGVTAEELADVVDQFWFDQLPTTPVDPLFGLRPTQVLPSPWPASPPRPIGVAPVPERAHDTSSLVELRTVVRHPPSRRRVWTYLVGGAVPTAAGATLALTPGGNDGTLPLIVGAVILAIGSRLAYRRGAVRRTVS